MANLMSAAIAGFFISFKLVTLRRCRSGLLNYWVIGYWGIVPTSDPAPTPQALITQ